MKIKNYITSLFFVLFLLVVFAGTLLTINVEKYSYKEAKDMPTMPEFSLRRFAKKEFINEFDRFIDCNYFLREMFLETACFIDKKVLLKNSVNEVFIIDNQLVSPVYEQNVQGLKDKAAVLNQLNKEKDGTELYFFLLPKKAELYVEEMNKKGANDYSIQDKQIFLDALDADVNIYNLVEYYRELSKTETLYFRTDHHNNHIGAYYSYVYMIDTIRKDFPSVGAPLSLEDFTITKVADDFCGSRGRLMGRLNVGERDDFYKITSPVLESEIAIEYEGEIYTTPFFSNKMTTTPDQNFYYNWYAHYMGANIDIVKVTNNAALTDLNLLVFKDSFMLPINIYLIQHFKTTTIIDLRHYEEEDLREIIQRSDIVIFGYSELDSFNTYKFY
ncbi:MAG: DHHW family protein [Eubacteriales bacterium]